MRTIIILVAAFGIYHATAFDIMEAIGNANKVMLEQSGPDGAFSDEATIIEGDIIKDRKPLAAPGERSAMFDWHKKLWRTRDIPYEISAASLRSSTNMNVIIKSLNKISDVTCLNFRPKRYSDNHWLDFYVASGCFSGVGRKYYRDSSPTRISLGNMCVHESIVVHEVLHALGFYHEQSRTDRDSFVKIYDSNIATGMESNFRKTDVFESYYYGTDYDYQSIMHYSKRSFLQYPKEGNTIEAQYDPNMKLGNDKLSATDITEIKRLYQCDVQSGWGKWTPWSPCLKNWRDDCTKAQVRMCLSEDLSLCPGADKYGTQDNVVDCPLTQCTVDSKLKDGHWSNWGTYSKCDSTCGWGSKTRTRTCSNPAPAFGGKSCVGVTKDLRLCRNPRCAGNSQNDAQFNKFSDWGGFTTNGFTNGRLTTNNGFTLKATSGWRWGGPAKDHTSELTGVAGYYASARAKGAFNAHHTKKQIWSPFIESYAGTKCIMFSYMLNGADLHPTNALSIFVKDGNGEYTNLNFRKGGHHGNTWQRAAVEFYGMKARFRFAFEVLFQFARESEVAIDDIFFDHNPCVKGLSGCEDMRSDCKQKAALGQCFVKSEERVMLTECCATCNDPSLAKTEVTTGTCMDAAKYATSCPKWAGVGECKRNEVFMTKNCCVSCKAISSCTKNMYADEQKCAPWASSGECGGGNASWMAKNCCLACKNHLKSTGKL